MASALIWSVAAIAFIFIAWNFMKNKRNRLSHMPGPPTSFFIGNKGEIDAKQPHIALSNWHKTYGPVYRVVSHVGETVVVGSYDAIYEVLIKKGTDFGGRYSFYRDKIVLRRSGLLGIDANDAAFKAMKAAAFKQLKPYGEGIQVIGSVIEQISDELMATLDEQAEKPVDVLIPVFNAAIKSVTFFLLKKHVSDEHPLVKLAWQTMQTSAIARGVFGEGEIIDRFPWVRFVHPFQALLIKTGKCVDDIKRIVLEACKESNMKDSYPGALYRLNKEGRNPDGLHPSKLVLTDEHIGIGAMELLVAGGMTTGSTFYTYMDIIKRRPDIQEKLYQEIKKVLGTNIQPSLDDRPKMPYARALIQELIRFTTVVSLSVGHKTLVDTSVGGYFVPKGTGVIANLWHLNHDPEFWGDPDQFRPERFLDESGELLPVDHPTRKHVIVFGAGTRVCIGEQLAMARLFIWTVDLTRKFEVLPVEDEGQHKTEMKQGNVIRPVSTLVYLKKRQFISK